MEICGCVGLRINNDSMMASPGHSVKYCPVHEAAPLMLAALEAAFDYITTGYNDGTPGDPRPERGDDEALDEISGQLHAAIAAARGE